MLKKTAQPTLSKKFLLNFRKRKLVPIKLNIKKIIYIYIKNFISKIKIKLVQKKIIHLLNT